MQKQTRYDKVADETAFYKWLDTCPVHSNVRKIDGDYVEIGFWSVEYDDVS